MKFSSSPVGRLAGVAFTVLSILLRVHMCHIPVLSRRCYLTVIPVLGLLTSRLSGDNKIITCLSLYHKRGKEEQDVYEGADNGGITCNVLPTPAQMSKTIHSN